MVLNRKRLNQFIPNQTFKMESLASILPLIKSQEHAVTIDLKEAYYHIPINPRAQRLLGFTVGEKCFKFKALPFGLKSAPRIFTRLVQTVAAELRKRGVKIFCYLDDWLILAPSPSMLQLHLQITIKLASELGFVINKEKSNFTPTVNPEFLGAIIDIPLLKASPTEHRIIKIQNVGKSLSSKPVSKAKDWQQFLGLLASLMDLVPFCRMQMRPLQLHLRKSFRPKTHRQNKMVPLTQPMEERIQAWITRPNLSQGKGTQVLTPELTIITDASHQGWGAHMGEKKSREIGEVETPPYTSTY